MGLGDDSGDKNIGTLFRDVKYYVVGNIPHSVSDHYIHIAEVWNRSH